MKRKILIVMVLLLYVVLLSSYTVFATDIIDESSDLPCSPSDISIGGGSDSDIDVAIDSTLSVPPVMDSVVEELPAEAPVAEVPPAEKPVVEEPAAEVPTVEKPVVGELVMTEPVTEEPTVAVVGSIPAESTITSDDTDDKLDSDSTPDVALLSVAPKGLATSTPIGGDSLEENASETSMLLGTRGVPSTEEPTPTIGARSATNSYGDVFLGGNYLEVGISKGGSFGTSTSAPSAFNSHASGKLGLLMDGDGWDVGNAPTTGDFFLPGSPEERYGIAYKINGKTYQYFGADRAGDTNITAYTTDDSDIANGILKATVHATTPHNVLVENTYSFGVDDKYYRTEVKITNNSGYEITDVRFFRSFDPDQDAQKYGYYDTYNKVICNPDSSLPGGEDNFAMVVARGGYTLEGFFLVSFDNRARASEGVAFAPDSLYMSGLWVESTPGLPTYSTDESLKMSKTNRNGYRYDDTGIAMTFNIGTLADGEETELSHFSSLDPDVIESINKIKDAISATVDNTTDNTLTIIVEEGYEYSIDGGKTWSTTGVFEGLDPDTEYTVLTRPINGTEEDTTEVVVSTKKSGPDAPNIKERIVTENSITVSSGENLEYSMDGGETWQDSPEFNSLDENTEYSIVARVKGTEDTMPGKISEPIVISTLPKAESNVEELEIVTVSVSINGTIDGIRINKGELFNAIGEDTDIENALEEGKAIEVKFIIKDSTLSSKELELVNSQLKKGEIIVLTVDISIELYIDNEYVKNITELETPITYTLTLPDSVLKNSKNFAVISTHKDSSGDYTVLRINDEDGDNNTITITSKDFSNYTIVCEKEEKTVAVAGTVKTDNTEINNNTNSADNTSSVAGTTLYFSTSGTGDNIMLYVVILIVACGSFVFLSIIDCKRSFIY